MIIASSQLHKQLKKLLMTLLFWHIMLFLALLTKQNE